MSYLTVTGAIRKANKVFVKSGATKYEITKKEAKRTLPMWDNDGGYVIHFCPTTAKYYASEDETHKSGTFYWTLKFERVFMEYSSETGDLTVHHTNEYGMSYFKRVDGEMKRITSATA